MKNYLQELKQLLLKKKVEKVKIKNADKQDDNTIDLNNIAQVLGLDFVSHDMKKLPSKEGWGGSNRFGIGDDNIIFFYPPNDGMPTCPFEFYRDKVLVIGNKNAYAEISNLDDILLQLVRVFSKGLDDKIVLDPYYFVLKLSGEEEIGNFGSAKLLITEKAIRNQKLNAGNFDKVTKYFINHFLDHFIGWNFGLSIKRNEQLKEEVDSLNQKVIAMGIREYAGTGFEVWCSDSVQHYDYQETSDLRGVWIKKNLRKAK